MTNRLTTREAADIFEAPTTLCSPVILNPDSKNFLLLACPSKEIIRNSIDEYGRLRSDARWQELIAPSTKLPGRINAFVFTENLLAHLQPAPVLELFNTQKLSEVKNITGRMTIFEQISVIEKLAPKTLPETTIYTEGRNDPIGHHVLVETLKNSNSAVDFFNFIIDILYRGFETPANSSSTKSLNYHQPRILEYLGLCARNLWLLFPFLTNGSESTHVRTLINPGNFRKIIDETYSIQEVPIFRAALENLKQNEHIKFAIRAIERLMLFSTLRKIEQVNTNLFARCLSLAINENSENNTKIAITKKAYNSLILIHNSRSEENHKQPLIARDLQRLSLMEFSSFEEILSKHPHLRNWGHIMSLFVQGHTNATYSGTLRKLSCDDFLNFLSDFPAAPEIHKIRREHINDYTESGFCFRNYIIKKYVSNETRNTKINDIQQLFSFAIEHFRVAQKDKTGEPLKFKNPVDLKFDKFKVVYRASSNRKSIPAEVIADLKSILIENNYEWPKTQRDWGHLLNEDTKQLEYVWCPSAAICLYLMLSIPIRGLQARMLDSGEGDAEIYDFESGKMITNKTQLPVDGITDKRRREGFIQVVPSGLPEEPEIVGLWVTVDKTSDTGYAIPYVSDELMKHLQFQREWIFRYAAHPNMQSIDDAQGYRTSPQEWADRQDKFYCLFRDPTAERLPDRSLPVSRSKMLHLWGKLCREAEKRKNSQAVNGKNRLKLVKEGTENSRYPVAKHDLHSLRVSGLTDLLDRGVPLGIVSEYVAGHKTYMMTLWYDKPTPGAVRQALMQASQNIGDESSALPRFTEDELGEMTPFLISNPIYEGGYTGFDALNDNAGLVQVREDGICPGSRCEEGGLDERKRIVPVPIGDRGPSCPQCRFYLTGPAFLLGQTIRGNDLILKIRNKVSSIAKSRQQIMAAEDDGQPRRADILRDRNDKEERQLNNMLTEWWHRMRFYESSVKKLDAYQSIKNQKNINQSSDFDPITLFKQRPQNPTQFGFAEASELEITHFMSTCTELLPSFEDDALKAHLDIELAVGKFLALSGESDFSALFFRLDEKQRLSTANLLIDLMLHLSNSPLKTKEILEGKSSIRCVPSLGAGIKNLFNAVKQITPEIRAIKK